MLEGYLMTIEKADKQLLSCLHVSVFMPSLSCRYPLDTFLGSEGQGPTLSVRINVDSNGLMSAYNISFPTTFSASDLRKAPFACR